MTKHEFLSQLEAELKKRKVADAADVVEEYEEHFAFKLADGYGEEEIAARLGDPAALAAQFEPGGETAQGAKRPSAALTWLWLAWADLFFGVLVVLLVSWGIVMVSCVLSFGLVGVCLAGNLRWAPVVTLPVMPYASALLLGLAMLGLAVACGAACRWYGAFVRQLLRAYGRFHRNALAPARGEPALPPLPVQPQLAPTGRRRLRAVLTAGFVCFGVFFVLGIVVSAVLAGDLQFWHVWGWFGYGA